MLYDVFIAHASEDKDAFVRPLVKKLKQFYLEVWYDEFSLTVGDSLRESIDKGLVKSRYGIVVLSPYFFKKKWPKRELNGLVVREMSEENSVILPIWHNITANEILKYSPPLAGRKAVKSSKGIDMVCDKLLKKLRPKESPLITARDTLISFGTNPSVVTDEWWLDVVEASNRIPSWGFAPPENSIWGRWTFPLPYFGSRGKDRGVWLAWTAMQMRWEKDAEDNKITQITKPETVLDFIDSNPGLKEICHLYPEFLATYAPQLTIRGFGGDFEEDFENMLEKSIKKQRRERACKSASGSGLTINHLAPACDELIALRHPTFGDYGPSHIACQFVQGDIGGPTPKYYEIFDYLVWFLSFDSGWLPKEVHEFLIDGMKKWAVWISSGDVIWDTAREFFHKLVGAKSLRTFKLTPKAKDELLKCFSKSLEILKLKDDPIRIRDKFLQEEFIEEYFRQQKRRNGRRK